MDEKDRLLLTYLRNGLPLTSRPFDVGSAKIGADTAEILVRIQRLKKEGVFEGIKAILDPRALHYQSAWVAVRIGQERQDPEEVALKEGFSAQFSLEELDSRADVFWQHPGVIYGCERDHELNVWFFITVPPDHDLELHVRCLEKLAGVPRALFLPARKVFKGTDLLSSLDAEAFPAMTERFEKRRVGQERQAPAETVSKDWPSAQAIGSSDLTAEETGMVRRLQEPFPLTDEPYRKIAADLGITEAQALELISRSRKRDVLNGSGVFQSPLRPS